MFLFNTLERSVEFNIIESISDISIHSYHNSVGIYLTCSKKSQSDNLLKCVLFGGVAPVAVTAHKSLNSSIGVVRNWELARTDPEEI